MEAAVLDVDQIFALFVNETEVEETSLIVANVSYAELSLGDPLASFLIKFG